MANLTLFTKTIEPVTHKNNGVNNFLIFKDSSIELFLKVSYNIDNTISEVTFTGRNFNNKKYKFKDFTWCPRTLEFSEHFLMHFDQSATPNSSITYRLLDSNPNDKLIIDKMNYTPNNIQLFLFKIYINNITPNTPITCRLDQATPKTKDGSIIISQ